MQDELIKRFVKDTNHATISKLPGISSAVARVNGGVDWKIIFVLQSHLSSGVSPKLDIFKSAGKDEQIFTIHPIKGERIWIYPDKVVVGDVTIYSKDMFIDPANPTDAEVQMLRMTKGGEIDSIMKAVGRTPARIIERLLDGKFVEEYMSPHNERWIVLKA